MKDVSWKTISCFNGPLESPGFLLWQVSSRWRRLLEATLCPLNLTHSQFVLLASLGWLTREGALITQSELACHCATDRAMTSQVLRTLERKGYIKRKHQDGNERSKFPSLTQKGICVIERALPLVESVDQEFFKKSEKDLEKLLKILKKLS